MPTLSSSLTGPVAQASPINMGPPVTQVHFVVTSLRHFRTFPPNLCLANQTLGVFRFLSCLITLTCYLPVFFSIEIAPFYHKPTPKSIISQHFISLHIFLYLWLTLYFSHYISLSSCGNYLLFYCNFPIYYVSLISLPICLAWVWGMCLSCLFTNPIPIYIFSGRGWGGSCPLIRPARFTICVLS